MQVMARMKSKTGKKTSVFRHDIILHSYSTQNKETMQSTRFWDVRDKGITV